MKTMQFSAIMLLMGIIVGCQKNSLSPNIASSDSDMIVADKISDQSPPGYPTNWIDPKNFVDAINNPYFSLTPGDSFFYQNVVVENGDTSLENIVVTPTHDIKVIEGINCEVIHDYVMVGNALTEDTYDYEAQDKRGDVWYFGEDTKSYDSSGNYSTEGSFTAGVDGAEAGVIMLSNPSANIGRSYRQEWYPGQAEDQAKIISTNETVTIGLGTYKNCLHTQEITQLEKGVVENKWYAPGVGQILTVVAQGGNEREELTGIHY